MSLFTPKQVAQAIGVSESSLKRWCDRGLIATVKTPGGHRKMTAAGVAAFLRERQQPLVRPELLGLPSNAGKTRRVLDRAAEQFHQALAAGDEEVCRQVLVDLFLSEHRLARVFDTVVAPAYQWLGQRWQCRELEVFEERKAVQIGIRILGEIHRLQAEPEVDAPLALGGTWEGDFYQLPTNLAELTLRESGWRATNLGSSLPFPTLEAAMMEHRPRLFWLSVSFVADEDLFVEACSGFLEKAEKLGVVVAMGGRELTERLRQRLRSPSWCNGFQDLEALAARLLSGSEPESAKGDEG